MKDIVKKKSKEASLEVPTLRKKKFKEPSHTRNLNL